VEDWEIFQRQLLRSAALAMRSNVCDETCWICDALITGDNTNTIRTSLPSACWRQLPASNFVSVCEWKLIIGNIIFTFELEIRRPPSQSGVSEHL
jgi:hypothetical protein